MPGSFLTSDLPIFFNQNEFAYAGQFKTALGVDVGELISGNYDYEGDQYNIGTGDSERAPHTWQMISTDLPAAVQRGHLVEITGEGEFLIIDIKPESTGTTLLEITPVRTDTGLDDEPE